MAPIEIPDSWIGKPIEGSLDRMLSKIQTSPQPAPVTPPIISGNMNPRDYIQVPQYNMVIAKAETHKGKNMFETLEALAGENMFMPSPAEFMRHWMNVKTAAVDRTNVLVYADGTNVSDAEALDLWNYMSSGHRGGAWTWLNALFKVEDHDEWYIGQKLKVVTNARGEKILEGTPKKLDCPIRTDCYVDLEFNAQGFPVRKSAEQQYKQGQNARFYHPRADRVARFDANSGRAYLDCFRDPSSRVAGLGVFACAAGSAPQNSGGSP